MDDATGASSEGDGGLRVLLVDDDTVLRRSLRLYLEREGHEVFEALDGNLAIAHLESRPVDIIVTDVFMPDMNGYQLLIRIRDVYTDVPIIMMSAGGAGVPKSEVLGAGAKLGAHRVLEKPFELAALGQAIAELTGNV